MIKKYILGTNGFTYTGGRKGENLFEKLSKSELAKERLKLVASGRGWKGATVKGYAWDEMQDFYKKLNIYLSTSLIEGIGFGVLEALACGIPVIIPKGVGVYDELPNAENIYRYETGDYDSMLVEIERCIEDLDKGALNRESLRSATAKFTMNSWINEHQQAFENLLHGVKSINTYYGDWQGKSGIYYVAYGEPAKECFIRALRSVRKFFPDLPVCLVSDKRVKTVENYQFIKYPDNDIGARKNKTLVYELAPKEWEYVLYLDSDTEVISEDIKLFFELLSDGFEFVICTNPEQYILAKDMERPDNKEEMTELKHLLGTDELLQYNGGVFAFRRCETTDKLLNGWSKEWSKYGKRDQAALDRVLYSMSVRVYTLGVEWNTVTRYLPAEISAGILHFPMQARRWKGRINDRLDSSEAWASVHPDK